MALRALRDGCDLNYMAYMAYGEWSYTLPHEGVEEEADGDRIAVVSRCPWESAFSEMGLQECGAVYCAEIDRGLVRGFNPNLAFEVESLLHDSDRCRLRFKNFGGAEVRPPQDGKRDWRYHCSHVYTTMREIVQATGFGDVMKDVDSDFSKAFGSDARYGLTTPSVNFNLID
jgi:hypothetical protein